MLSTVANGGHLDLRMFSRKGSMDGSGLPVFSKLKRRSLMNEQCAIPTE